MDLLLNLVAVFVLAIPLGFAAALFLRVAPYAFGLGRHADLGWPTGVQEEDPESAWARHASPLPPDPAGATATVNVATVKGRMGRGTSRR